MDVFIATQPIFDENEKVHAYEILYRSGNTNAYTETDGDFASSKVIANTFQTFGLEQLTNNKPAFINFTENLIKEELATLLPTKYLVVEILENIEPTQEIIEKCSILKEKGYTLALDDFVFSPKYAPLIKLANIIKIDFLNTSKTEIIELANKFSKNKVLLAEKIETREDFEFACKHGYKLFQGYFFSKPKIVSTKDIAPIKFTYLQLINKLTTNMDFEEVARIIQSDVSLSYKILKLINSAAFGFRNKITSIKQAVVALGEKELRKWLSLIAFKGIGDDKPDEVIRTSLLRARFMEYLSKETHLKSQTQEIFLTGLFSMLDVVMGRPLEDLLNDIQASEDIKNTLINNDGLFSNIYNLAIFYEQADWSMIEIISKELSIPVEIIANLYVDALKWTDSVLGENK